MVTEVISNKKEVKCKVSTEMKSKGFMIVGVDLRHNELALLKKELNKNKLIAYKIVKEISLAGKPQLGIILVYPKTMIKENITHKKMKEMREEYIKKVMGVPPSRAASMQPIGE